MIQANIDTLKEGMRTPVGTGRVLAKIGGKRDGQTDRKGKKNYKLTQTRYLLYTLKEGMRTHVGTSNLLARIEKKIDRQTDRGLWWEEKRIDRQRAKKKDRLIQATIYLERRNENSCGHRKSTGQDRQEVKRTERQREKKTNRL